MVAVAGQQKALMNMALSQAKAALKGQGAAESGPATAHASASVKDKKPSNKAVTLSKRRLRKVRIRV